MKTINTKASNSVDNVAIAVSVLSWLCIIAGVIAVIMSISWDESVAGGLALIGAGILGFITKALITGFHKIVYASELYIHQNTPREE